MTMPPPDNSRIQIASRLLEFEEFFTPKYKQKLVELPAAGMDIYVVSDLHLAGGLTLSQTYTGTENFFADNDFRRFLDFAHERLSSRNKRAYLMINGDFIDFLRVADVPKTNVDFARWEDTLRSIGITDKPASWLQRSISRKEKKFGLKTHNYKSVWRLGVVLKGHAVVFAALAQWLDHGHHLAITKGNHDLEWYWPEVRNFLRLSLAQAIHLLHPRTTLNQCLDRVFNGLTFVDDACVIDSTIYIEHGHKYDRIAHVVGGPTLGTNDDELNLPFGSFFNRYFINRIELAYPFYDNVRPRQNILPLLLREHFFYGLKILFAYFPFALRVIPKGYFRYLLKPLTGYLLAFGIPLALAIVAWGQRIGVWLTSPDSAPHTAQGAIDLLEQKGVGLLKDTGMLFLTYIFSRIVTHFQLDQPDYLRQWALPIVRKNPGYQCVTMGHTHNPEQYDVGGRWYINSSTWIPVIEADSSAVREDRTYAVVLFERLEKGQLTINPLLRWNDDAGRLEPLDIVTHAEES